MRATDLSTRQGLSRRAMLGVAPLILLGGCTSATEQAHQRFFAAVKADPLYSWRPDQDPTFFRKNLKAKKDIAGCRLQIVTYDDMSGLFFKFVSWTPTS